MSEDMPHGRKGGRMAAIVALALIAAVPPVALAATAASGGVDTAETLPTPRGEEQTVADPTSRPRAQRKPTAKPGGTAAPSANSSGSASAPVGTSAPKPGTPSVAVDAALQRQASAWIAANVGGGASHPALVIDDPATRAAAGVGDAGFTDMPLLARFGQGSARIDVRRRTARPDTLPATRAFLADDTVVGTTPAARDAALVSGLDVRLLTALRGFTAGDNLLSSVQAFPSTAPEAAARAPRRMAEITSLNTYDGASSMFGAEAQRFKDYLSGLPAGQRPAYAAVEQRGGRRVFVVKYAVQVGAGS